MSTTDDWRRHNAFGLPAGSVRALLALAIFGSIWAWLLLRPDDEVPDYLQNLLFIVLGHYFAARKESVPATSGGPPPLFLPRGSVRLLLLGGCVVVAILLFRQDRVWLPGPEGAKVHRGALTLLLVAGFLLGVVLARLWAWWSQGKPSPRWLEDGRGVIALVAVGLLILLVFEIVDIPAWGFLEDAKKLAGGKGIHAALAALVGFYFGSRS